MLEDDRVRMFVAWADGEPVGEATGYLANGTVGIFGVGVVNAARRRGDRRGAHGARRRAFGDRADLVWLQPSDIARGMYERLGFARVSDWEVWIA